jgi:hypothetical protein
MNVLKLTLVVVALLGIAILSGCQEEYSKKGNMSNVNKVAFQNTETGYWHPVSK